MKYYTYETEREMSLIAARNAALLLKNAISMKGSAAFMAATGRSQIEFLENLCNDPLIDWGRTTMFHLDEYIGIAADHPASFRNYLKERLIDKVHPGTSHLIDGTAPSIEKECDRLNSIIREEIIDVAFIGIGENGHLAFNDPPADFETEAPFIVVELDDACKKQQVGEGWFARVNDVPDKAITVSISQIMKSKNIICVVPGQRKARAVKGCIEGDMSSSNPASILKKHKNTFIYLDKESASMLTGQDIIMQNDNSLF